MTIDRDALLERLKTELGEGRTGIRREFEAGVSGPDAAAALSRLVDHIIVALHDAAIHGSDAAPLAVVAVGGYGRGELAPYSDVDLLFLLGRKATSADQALVEFVLYMLWDLGLQVGHASRTVDQCLADARADMTIRTTLVEARLVAGHGALFATLRCRFRDELVDGTAADFVRAKLAERNDRHERMGDSRYVLEPNIKDGKGGLRDLHTLFWIAKYLYRLDDVSELVERGVLTAEEHSKFAKAAGFLWTLRFHHHYLAGRAEERLTFDVQPEMARRLRYSERAGLSGVERFMKHYFLVAKDVGDLTRIFCASFEAEHRVSPLARLPRWGALRREIDGFVVERGRLMVAHDDAFTDDPVAMVRLFQVADSRALDIHPGTLRLITQNLRRIDAAMRKSPEAGRLFLDILTSRHDPETALRRMNEAGVLGRLVPDFGRVVGQVQHDMYHVYTVDEHTIRAVGVLAAIERGDYAKTLPLATGIIHQVLSRRVLYLATFLHDIAKGRGGDHSELGADIAVELGAWLGFTPEEVEQTAWLVRRHLLFSNTAFRRDLGDAKTVDDFVAEVQSHESLRLLLVLTAADIRAVGPNVWNAWKGALLRQLYALAAEVMSGGHAADEKDRRVATAKETVGAMLAGPPDNWTDERVARHLERLYPPYWLGFDAESHARHAAALDDADRTGAPLVLDSRVNHYHGVTEVTLVAPDQPGLFSKVAGAVAVAGATIVDAKIFTTSDRVALDILWLQDAAGGAFDCADHGDRLTTQLEQALDGGSDPGVALANRRSLSRRAAAAFPVNARVLMDNNASTQHTIIEVNGRDRPGLLYDVTRALSELGLSIVTAHISTYGERVVDVFYVKDVYGLKVDHEGQIEKIRNRLLDALAEPAPVSASSKASAAE